ncbi:MAG: PfkB family carbohydrate kinase [Phycisphaerales bacterium]
MALLTITLNPTIDRVVGEELPDDGILFAAGKGVNVSRALARLGVPSTAIVLCPDADHAFFADALAKLGPGKVEFVPIPVAGRVRRRVTDAMTPEEPYSLHEPEEDETGAYEIEASGAEITQLGVQLLRQMSESPAANLVAFCGSLPPGLNGPAFDGLLTVAMTAGAKVLVDSRGEAALAAARRPIWLWKGNREEVDELPEDVRQQAELIAMTLGVGVSVGLNGKMPLLANVSLPQTHPAIDDIGCGDACTAGLLASWSKNPGNLAQMAKWGVAAGTACAAAVGPGEIDPVLFKRLAASARASTADSRMLIRRGMRDFEREREEEGERYL